MKQHLEEKIRARAYEIWEREGRPHGREQEHWEAAAAELGAPDMPRHENLVSGVEDDEPAASAQPQAAEPQELPAGEDGGSRSPEAAAAAPRARAARAKAPAKPRGTKGTGPKA